MKEFDRSFVAINLAVAVLFLLKDPNWVYGAYALFSVALAGLFMVLKKNQDTRIDELRKDLKHLNDRVDGMNLSKGFGR